MSDEFIPKPGSIKIGGLGPKAARLQAMREKLARQNAGGKQHFDASSNTSVKGKDSFTNTKKSTFNRKAV